MIIEMVGVAGLSREMREVDMIGDRLRKRITTSIVIHDIIIVMKFRGGVHVILSLMMKLLIVIWIVEGEFSLTEGMSCEVMDR